MAVSNSSSNVEQKTPAAVSNNIPIYKISDKNVNPLNQFRTFNYIFTLSVVPNDALENTTLLPSVVNDFVIASSKGKTSDNFNPDNASGDSSGLVQGFNEMSSGRFDLFIENVQIDTVMAFSAKTNVTMATKINFEIFEPYSINGFLEALQVGAIATGHNEYLTAPVVLKMQFAGYTDEDNSSSVASSYKVLENDGTRYFVMTINTVDVELDERGTRYRIGAVPYNEIGYGRQNATKTTLQIKGKNVGTALEDLMVQLTTAAKESLKLEAKNDPRDHDQYEIVFPTRTAKGYNYNGRNDKIYNSLLTENFQSANRFVMPDPGSSTLDAYKGPTGKKQVSQFVFDTSPSGKTTALSIGDSTFNFPHGSNIADIISSVIRDSSFVKDIYRNGKDKSVKDGLVEYFHIALEVTNIKNKFNKDQLKPARKFKFLVLPYKMHYSRIPAFQDIMTDADRAMLESLYVKRVYNYIYTGKNIDVRSFNLKFNNLFYQAYPTNLGQVKIFSNDPTNDVDLPINPKQVTQQKEENQKISADPLYGTVQDVVNQDGPNATQRTYDQFDSMAKTMHQAVLDNLDMVTCDLDILGDPYFLCTGGMGNQRHELEDEGITVNGEAPYQSNDVVIVVNFRTPKDISGTGQLTFVKTPFSGCFRVTSVSSTFSSGLFTQRLHLVRIPGQPEDQGRSGIFKTKYTSANN